MKRIATLIFHYYRIVLLYNVLFTGLWFIALAANFGEINVVVLVWAKVCGFWSAAGLHYYYANQSYFYFRNAGYRMRTVLLRTFLADVFLFLIAIIIAYATKGITYR